MSMSRLDFFSTTLQMDQTVYVILPDKGEGAPPEPPRPAEGWPVLTLLHGTSHDGSNWLRFTGIERYCTDKKVAAVLPSAQLSGYADMVYGPAFFTYLTKELPAVLRKIYPLSDRREDNFVAGVSMGGYGAAKIGLSDPEHYSVIGALSNGNHAYIRPIGFHARRAEEEFPASITDARHLLCWGIGKEGDPRGTKEDLYTLAEQIMQRGGPYPKIFHTCGSFDRNLVMARHMRDFFESLEGNPFDYQYVEDPYGEHTWEYWDKWIRVFIAGLPVRIDPSRAPM